MKQKTIKTVKTDKTKSHGVKTDKITRNKTHLNTKVKLRNKNVMEKKAPTVKPPPESETRSVKKYFKIFNPTLSKEHSKSDQLIEPAQPTHILPSKGKTLVPENNTVQSCAQPQSSGSQFSVLLDNNSGGTSQEI